MTRARCLALLALIVAPALLALPAAAAGPKLLMLPIVVHSAEDPDYLRSGLSDMLASRFERIGALELLRIAPDAQGTTDPDRALALARKAGADYVLYGSFTRFGRGASLDVQCAPAGPDVAGAERQAPLREIFVHSGSIGEIIPDLDELAGKVSRFAQGEQVLSSAGDVAAGGAGPGASSPQIAELEERVAALEAAFAEALEGLEAPSLEAPGTGDLR
jgi:hypothetical protein